MVTTTANVSLFMMKSRLARGLCLICIPGLLVCGCAEMTPAQKAAWGTGLGAVGGGLIGAVVGALAGAAIGGTAGYLIGKSQERQLASRQQVEQQELARQQAAAPQAGTASAAVAAPPVVQMPVVRIEEFTVTPNQVTGGSEIHVRATYRAFGPRDEAPTGTITLMKGDKQLASMPLEAKGLGEVEIDQTLTLPADAESGPYIVVITMQHGSCTAEQHSRFIVA